jgi:DUF1009 family protein
VVAIEGADGTDAMLARVGEQGRASGGILVKRPKPGQELRVDMPAIGPATVRRAADARLAGVAVLAGATLAAERDALRKLANSTGLFVQGFRDPAPTGAAHMRTAWRVESLTRRAPDAAQHADATKGADVVEALAPLTASLGAVVARGHVLAVESGEGATALLARAAGLRQWGRRLRPRRTGVAVLSEEADLVATIAAASEAGLAGVAVVGHPAAAAARAAAGAADRLGLFLAVLSLPVVSS